MYHDGAPAAETQHYERRTHLGVHHSPRNSMQSISRSLSLSTIAPSSSSHSSFPTSCSSGYSLSTTYSDVELGSFVDDNTTYYSTREDARTLHQDYAYRVHASETRRKIPLPFEGLGARNSFDRSLRRLRKKLARGALNGYNRVSLSPWECFVYALLVFYVWVFFCTLVGDTRTVQTCPALPGSNLSTHDGAVPSPSRIIGPPSHIHKLVPDIVAKEHARSPV
ncbi:hypothetical protein BDW22DRAFT_1355272 [Trametopsis cervina]|nr:hypothetical protein BDW22DRAFT_1355272 [Trametopsis cervina]